MLEQENPFRVTDPLGNVFRYTYDETGSLAELALPAGASLRYDYDAGGRLERFQMRVPPGGANAPADGLVGDSRFNYDLRGKQTGRSNAATTREVYGMAYSGLGHLVESFFGGSGQNATGTEVQRDELSKFSYDALGNLFHTYAGSSDDASTEDGWLAVQEARAGKTTSDAGYDPATGRLLWQKHHTGTPGGFYEDQYTYDAAGNLVATVRPFGPYDPAAVPSDRHSYYGAGGALAAVDTRRITNYAQDVGVDRPETQSGRQEVWIFEEHRYDALGRRVLTWTRRWCDKVEDPALCRFDTVRRTV